LIVLLALSARALAGELRVRSFCEERWKDDDLALFDPQRMELTCRSGKSSPWGFSFAGFETQTREPIEIEVSGSGGYEPHDMFSIAALSIDFGSPSGGWSQRTLLGLGMIGGGRPPHPPGWGVGMEGKVVCPPDLLKASTKPQRATIDFAKYAPADWDGRLWIGVFLHNAGARKSLSVRIVKPPPPGGDNDKLPEPEQWKLLQAHQKQFLDSAIETIDKTPPRPAPPRDAIPAELQAYAAAADSGADGPAARRAAQGPRRLRQEPVRLDGIFETRRGFLSPGSAAPSAPPPAERFNNFLSAWKDRGQFGKAVGCVIRRATNMDKVGLTDLDTGRILAEAHAIDISAARNEHDGFQVVLTPLPGATENVSLSVTDLEAGPGNGGGGARKILSSAFTINPVGYVKIYPGPNASATSPTRCSSVRSHAQTRRKPARLGERPRPARHTGRPLLRTRVDPRGRQRDGVDPVASARARLRHPEKNLAPLQLLDFPRPDQPFLSPEGNPARRLFPVDRLRPAARVNPIDVYEGHCEPLLDISLPRQKWDMQNTTHVGTPNPKPDWTKWDQISTAWSPAARTR
jgi:hypothetical protein